MTRAKVRATGAAEREAAVFVARHEAEQRAQARVRAAARREEESKRPAVTVPADAVIVRIRHLTWFPMVRVNRTTVTVKTGYNPHTGAYSTVRYPLADVVAVAR